MEFNEATFDEIQKYLVKAGKRGSQVLSILGQISPSVHAIFGTEVGREILSDDIARIDELLKKVYLQKAGPIEMAELEYLRERRIPKIIGKLKTYLEGTGEIKKNAK